jgi:hypothetical protein
VRYVRRAANDPAFLLKALGESSGELRRLLHGLPRRALLLPGDADDDVWSLLGIITHMRDVELGVHGQMETILTAYRAGEPRLRHVGIDDIPFREDYEDEDEDEVLEELHYYRRQTSYLLWSCDDGDWDRAGIHPYRGRLTLLDLARDLYQHDLEHLWQARRMVEALGMRSR